MGKFDMIYFAIPEDGRGPAFGPVLEENVAQIRADAMPGYVVGINIDSISFKSLPEDARE